MKTWITSAVLTLFVAGEQKAGEPMGWWQFRGPNGSGVADDQKPPVEFGPDKNVKWKVAVPHGISSPIIVKDKLILTAFDDGKLYTIAYNRADGKELWRSHAPAKKIEPYYKAGSSPAAPTSATDGERIVSYFGSCGVFCYDLSGKELWKYDIPIASIGGNFGTATSPLVADGTVVIVRDESKSPRIIALDLTTGKPRWEKKRQSHASWCTPVVWDTPAGKQVVAAGHGKMIGYDLKTGDEKWFVPGMPSGCCTSPVAVDGKLFFAGWSPGGPDDKESQMPSFDSMLKNLDKNKDGALQREEAEKAFEGFFDVQDTNGDGKITREEYETILKFMAEGKNSAFALKPGGNGDVTKTNMLWKQTKGLPYLASALVYRGQYVMVRDGGIVTALDMKKGTELYRERGAAAGSYYASPVAANGHIYFTTLEDGVITVVKAGTDKLEVVAKNPKLNERTAATPAIADDTLYVRTDKHLYAFATKK